MSNNTAKERLIKERDDLVTKYEKLNVFLLTDKSLELSDEAITLLNMQRETMSVYIQILTRRISIWVD